MFLLNLFYLLKNNYIPIFKYEIQKMNYCWQGYLAILVFIVILTLALIYEWRSGALNWGVKSQTGRQEKS